MSNEKKEYKWTLSLVPMDWRLIFRLMALIVSWYFNHSIGWAILHYFFGWYYLIYIILTGGFADGGLNEIIRYYFG